MKKIVLSAAVVFAAFAAQAQLHNPLQTTIGGTMHQDAHPVFFGSHAITNGVWVTSTDHITLNLWDVITITPITDNDAATFDDQADYNSGLQVGSPNTYAIQSNRVYDVTVGTSASTFSVFNTDNFNMYSEGDNATMPASVLKLHATAPAGSGTVQSMFGGSSNYGSLAVYTAGTYSLGNGDGPGTGHGALLISDGLPGGSRSFTSTLRAEPGWNYVGGTYTIDVVYTAAQE